jgi:HK97 family phage prohead protease
MPPRANLDLLPPPRAKRHRASGCAYSLPIEFKDIGIGDDRFTLLAAVFGNIDRGGDVCVPGCVKNAAEFINEGSVFWNHDQNIPIGYPIGARETADGFEVDARWHTTPEAQKYRTIVRDRLASGRSTGSSIGYKVRGTPSTQWVNGRSVRILDAIDIFEVSVVPIAMNPLARVLDAKGDLVSLDDVRDWFECEYKSGRALSRANLGKLKAVHEALRNLKDDLAELIIPYVGEDELLLSAREDIANDIVPDDNDQRSMEDRTYAQGKAPRSPSNPLVAGGNTIVGQGSATSESMEAARRGKSVFVNPTSDRQLALDQMRRQRQAQEYIDAMGTKSIATGLAALPERHPLRDLSLSHRGLTIGEAFRAQHGRR